MKSNKLIKALLFVAALAIISTGMLKLFKNSKAKDHPPLIEYSYTYGGDMIGSYRSTTVRKLDNDTVYVCFSYSPSHNIDATNDEYHVPASLLADIEKVFDKYKMYTYNDLPKSDFFVLDGGTESFYFTYEGYGRVNFSDNKKIPTEGYDGLKEIDALIKTATENGTKLPALVLQPQDEECYSRVVEGQVILSVFSYCDGYLGYRIANGTDRDVQIKEDIRLYKLENGDMSLVITDEDSAVTVDPNYAYENSIKIKNLAPGSYLLVRDEYESVFRIA